MAGYLIGLGDRHLQNILIDRRSAEVRCCLEVLLILLRWGEGTMSGHHWPGARRPDMAPFCVVMLQVLCCWMHPQRQQ